MTDQTPDRDRLIADLQSMVRIPSVNPFGDDGHPHPAEAAMADYLEAQMQALGLETHSADVAAGRRNVWGILRGAGTGPTILLAGHTDTVGVEGYDDPFSGSHAKGRIYGRGSCDMKAGLAAYLEVARLIIASGTPLAGDLIIAGVIDEEHAMAGSKAFGTYGPAVDCAIVAEPTLLNICPVHKGQILMTLRTEGTSAHSSMPQNGVNAVYHMGHVLRTLERYAADLAQRTPDPMCGAPSFSVGVIRGGDNACSVPDYCEIDIDRRTIPGEDHTAVLAEIRTLLDQIAQEVPSFKAELQTPFLNLPPLSTTDDAPVLQAVSAACQEVTGACTVQSFPGSTDAPHFNCPTVICGPGDLAQCHSLDEYVEVRQIEDAVRIYLVAIRAMQP